MREWVRRHWEVVKGQAREVGEKGEKEAAAEEEKEEEERKKIEI